MQSKTFVSVKHIVTKEDPIVTSLSENEFYIDGNFKWEENGEEGKSTKTSFRLLVDEDGKIYKSFGGKAIDSDELKEKLKKEVKEYQEKTREKTEFLVQNI